MRLSVLCLTALFLVTAPARSEVHACSLLTEAEVGALIGKPIRAAPPEVEGLICAGFCPMRGIHTTWCTFSATDRSKTALYFELDPPPHSDPSWSDRSLKYYSRETGAQVEEVRLPEGKAVWYFRADQAHGFLEAFIGQRVWFQIGVEGMKDGATARHIAERAAAIALARYDAK